MKKAAQAAFFMQETYGPGSGICIKLMVRRLANHYTFCFIQHGGPHSPKLLTGYGFFKFRNIHKPMQLHLKNIVPIPLKDKFSKRGSDLWNTTLHFTPGEWVKIKAPSGTGKTTFVHIIYKLRHDYEGAVAWNSTDLMHIAGDNLAKMRQQNISIIFQDLRLFANLTARENIELNRVLATPFYESSVIDAMAEKLGVAHILGQRAGLCSYGEQQRIAIIRALVQPFSWLIMDEPFSHLDRENIQKASALIADECSKRNAGFILTDLDIDDHFAYSRLLNL